MITADRVTELVKIIESSYEVAGGEAWEELKRIIAVSLLILHQQEQATKND